MSGRSGKIFSKHVVILFAAGLAGGEAGAQSGAQSEPALEEVVVTAQRRAQDLQTVPIAISAFTEDTLINAGIDSTGDLPNIAPGLVWVTGRVAASVYLRGMGATNHSVGHEQPIANYVDGIYYPDMNGSTLSLANVERVEVLRGPQGTLFGRNAVGGLINIITKTPSQESGGSVEVGYGNYDTFHTKFYGTTGITENVAADLSVYYYDQSGNWGRNFTTGEDINTEDQTLSLRSKWHYEPSDNTRVTLAVDYLDREADIGTHRNFFPGTRALDGTTTFVGDIYDSQSERSTDDATSSSEQAGVGLTAEHDLERFTIRSLTAYRDASSALNFDVDGTSAPVTTVVSPDQSSEHFTQEINILSAGDSTIEWILGVFYLQRDAEYGALELHGTDFPPGGLRFHHQWNMESIAGFGQATFPLPMLPDTNLTLGVRQTSDRVEFDTSMELIAANLVLAQATDRTTWSEPTWRVVLDHRFSSDVMGYVSYNRGFKSGVYNNFDVTGTPINPEIADAYEMGLKSDLLDQRLRLNAVVFYSDYQNLQLEVASDDSINTAINAPAGEVWGVEFDMEAVVTDRLNVRGNLSWIPEAEYKDFPFAPFLLPNPDGGNVEVAMSGTGQRMVNTPEYTLNLGADYTIPVGFGSLIFSGNYNYNDGSYWTVDNRTSGNRRHIVNLSGTWRSANEHWNARLWTNNLLDEEYYTEGFISNFGDTASPAAPRTFGLSVGYEF